MSPLLSDEDPLDASQPLSLKQYHERSLLALLICIGLTGPLVGLGVFLRDGAVPLMWVAVAVSLAMYLLLFMYWRGPRGPVATLLVYTLIFSSAAAVAVHGTVRSSAAMVMLAAVVGAGVFLPRRNLIICASLGVGLLAALNIAENQGLLPTPQLHTGWVVWILQTAVLVSLVVTVNLGRHRLVQAYRTQHHALQRAYEIERLLRQSQDRFHALFRSTPAACLVQSIDTKLIVDANGAFETLFGYKRDALVGQPLPPLWLCSRERQAFADAVKTVGSVRGMRATAVRQDGSEFDAALYAEVASSASEHMLIAMVIDVSAEVASRRELEKSRERFSKTFNFSPLGMIITRLSDGRFVEVNPAYERVLGWTPKDLQGKTALESGIWVQASDRQQFMDALNKAGHLQGFETRMRTKSGQVVPVRIWAELIDIDDEPCILSFALNVAEEKRREAMLLDVAEGVSGETGEAFFRSLVEHLAAATGADGVMVGEVDSQRRLHTLASVWQGAQGEHSSYPIEQTLCEQVLQHGAVLRLHSTEERPLSASPAFGNAALGSFVGLPLRDLENGDLGVLVVVWRTTTPASEHQDALLTIFASRSKAELLRLRQDREIRKLQDTLELRVAARTEQLQYLNRELDAFAYSVSHDLKSPLRAIEGFSHILHEMVQPRLEAPEQELFERIESSVQRMNVLIADLLALARVSQGTLQRMDTDLSELANDVIRHERQRDPARKVHVEIADGLIADCDPRLARIVLENLLGNAWKYTRLTAEPRISLHRVGTASDGTAMFCVRDNGAGFDMARAQRLFTPFTRLHSSADFEGTGIGLATVRRIIERHGGQVRGEAAVGQGATFEFSFGLDTPQ